MQNSAWLSSVDLLSDTLAELIGVSAVTGQEDALAEKITEMLSPLPLKLTRDALGNLTAVLNPEASPKVAFFAHLDEVGWVVKKIDRQGYLHLYPLGGVPEKNLRGQWVRVNTRLGPVPGAAVSKPPHLAASSAELNAVDVGANTFVEAEGMGIRPGDPVTIERNYQRMANPERAIGRCFDNRMGCALLIHLLRHFAEFGLEGSLVAVFTAMEEHGMSNYSRDFNLFGPGARGAWLPAHKELPDLAFVVDSNTCSDLPGLPDYEVMVEAGHGPVLRFLDDLTIVRREMRDFMLETAAEMGIHVQIGFSMSYTDASAVQFAGFPVGVIGIPLRYIHSPAQVLHLPDLLTAVQWAAALTMKAGEYIK